MFSLPSPGRYVPDGPLDEARFNGERAKVMREVSVREGGLARILALGYP